MSRPAPVPHDPVVDVRVLARDEKTGRPTVVEHYCRTCGLLVSDGRHVKA